MEIYHAIAENVIIRGICKFVDKTVKYFQKVIGLFRFKALVKKSGRGSFYSFHIDIKYGNCIEIGDNTTIGPYTTLGAKGGIKIGSNVRISKGVIIETAGLDMTTPPPYNHSAKPIVIGDGVWIASNAIILGGVNIGDHSVIGAGVVVTKSLPPNTIVVGQAFRVLEKKVSFN